MTTRNRLAQSTSAKPKLTQQQICDEANDRMAADPEGRRDIHWVVRNGRAALNWKYPPSHEGAYGH